MAGEVIKLATAAPDPFPPPQPAPDPCTPGVGPNRTVIPGARFNVAVTPVKSGAGNVTEIAGANPGARSRTITNFGDDSGANPPGGTTIYVAPASQKGGLASALGGLPTGARIPPGGSRTIATVEPIYAVSAAGEPAGGNIVDVVTEYDA